MKQTFVAAHALIKRGNSYLVTRRSKQNDYMPQLYDIPGGTIEFGENVLKALRREIKEETGLIIDPKKILFCYGYLSNENRHQFQLVYLSDYVSGEVKLNPQEHSEFRWLKFSEMKNLKKIAFLKSLYEELKNQSL